MSGNEILFAQAPKVMDISSYQPSFPSRKHRRSISLIVAVAVLMLVHHLYWRRQYNLLVESRRPQIPAKIWQISLPHSRSPKDLAIDPEQLADTRSWIAQNPDHAYRLMGLRAADRFVDEHFARSAPAVARAYRGLANPGLKSDLLRYLVLSVEGGVYCDTDTTALRPADDWVPEAEGARGRARLVVGLEFDRLDGPRWADIPHDVQFCQWAIAAAPGHPVFGSMIHRAVGSLEELAAKYNASLGALEPTSFEVMNSTGPAAWTDVVWEHLRRADPENLTDLRDLSGMTVPRLYGDILVLPIDGFGMGQVHSHSTNDGSIPAAACLRHNFRGSWRDD